MDKFKVFILIAVMLVILPSTFAATLEGSVYNSNLDIEQDVLLEINTVPIQKFLSKDGQYSFKLLPGDYVLTARNGLVVASENVEIKQDGTFVFDIFLFPSLAEEDELWQDTEERFFTDEEKVINSSYSIWSYIIAGIIVVFSINRIIRARRKYGPLAKFRKRVKVDQKKTVEEHQEELAQEPGYLEKTLEIIKKYDGRISQKELRKELAYLSEAKVSLIITDLEHKGKVEKVKKGRGNVIILKKAS